VNPYASFVADFTRLMREARKLPLGGFPMPVRPAPSPEAPCALIFSPHPDDEVIIGALPLRLLRELNWRVINVAVTLGSKPARRQERWKELQDCCRYIGFDLVAADPAGLEGINLEARARQPGEWRRSVERIAVILAEHKPRAIFLPHDDDWNVTHIGTHHLVAEALAGLGDGFACHAVETEFWGAMDTPNLMIESSEADIIDLITALTFHVGEVRRNPYHLRLAAWLMDNVRRGSELVGGQGGAAPEFLFGTLYRLRRWRTGRFEEVLPRGRFVSKTEGLVELFADLPENSRAPKPPTK
jgi:LmbE family N-acetylglucosaminyl deacetylase